RLVGLFRIQLRLQYHFLVKLTHHDGFLVGRLRSFHLRLVRTRQIHFVQFQTVRTVGHVDVFAAREDLVPAMLLIPLRDGRVLVHVLDDVSPTNTRVVGAKGDFAFL